MLEMALRPWISEVLVIFHKKSFLSFFLPCLGNSYGFSFVTCFILVLAWFLITIWSLWYFSASCNTFWNSIDRMCLSCIACERISAMLSDFLWASRLITSCFSWFTIYFLKDFCAMAAAGEKSCLDSLNAIPTRRTTPFANAAVIVINK